MHGIVPSVWEQASSIDRTVSVKITDLDGLIKKRVNPQSYSRARLFSAMARGRICLFSDFSVPVLTQSVTNKLDYLLSGIETSFHSNRNVTVQAGPRSRLSRVSVTQLMDRWKRSRAIVSVTDLHFRGTRFEKLVDISPLSDFNVLCSDPKFRTELMEQIEMMTLVISSKGNITDNHTDDCDGSNHCFVGKKLWLAWDRMEGRARGFQDVDRDGIVDTAAFDMKEFILMPSSRWFTVNDGETLFLPGSFTHKVITLEPYIGLGSFHVALPSYIRCLQRWILYDTLDVGPKKLLEKINDAVIRRIQRLQKTEVQFCERWGLREMKKSISFWRQSENKQLKESLFRHPLFADFLSAATR